MLIQKYKEKREEQLRDNFSNSQEGIQEKGKHSFPYLNSMKSELSTCMHCCLKLINLMLKILELLRNEKISVHWVLRLKSRQENFL